MAGLSEPRDIPDGGRLAVQVWNEMGGDFQWAALPLLCEIHGIDDLETLITQLIAIRDTQARKYGGQ